MLDVRRLRVLRELAHRGTVAAAAEALSYTPSAVSQQLSQLEREAGVPLFERAGRRLRLTEAARELVVHADAVLDRLERAEAGLAAHSGEVRGTVRLAAFQLAGRALAVPALPALAAAHPALRVDFAELGAEAALPLVAGGRLDLAIAEEYEHAPRPRTARLERVVLTPDEILLVLPRDHPSAAAGGPVPLASLRAARWATAPPGTAYAEMVAGLCRSAGGFEPDVRHRASDMSLLLDLVARAGAVALLPSLGRPARDERVAVRALAEGSFPRIIFAAVRTADRKRPATAAVLAALRHAARSDP